MFNGTPINGIAVNNSDTDIGILKTVNMTRVMSFRQNVVFRKTSTVTNNIIFRQNVKCLSEVGVDITLRQRVQLDD